MEIESIKVSRWKVQLIQISGDYPLCFSIFQNCCRIVESSNWIRVGTPPPPIATLPTPAKETVFSLPIDYWA